MNPGRLLFAAVLLLAIGEAAAQPVSSQDSEAKAACEGAVRSGVSAERLRLLERGFNLPGLTDEWPPRPPSEAMLAALRARGFTHIRLPIRLELVSERFSPPTTVQRSLQQIDRALDMLLRLDFAVSIDLHPGERFGTLYKSDPEAGLKELLALWPHLARRVASKPADRVFLEALNEPTVAPGLWKEHAPRIAAGIRSAAPDHTIIIGPANNQRFEGLEEMTPLADRNVVYAFHYYDPMAFTHQGQTWSADPLSFIEGVPFPATLTDVQTEINRLMKEGRTASAQEVLKQFREPWNAKRIEGAFARVARWAARHGRAAIVNEFGALSFKASPQARANWIRAVRAAAERFCIGWTHWEYADAFGFVRRENGRETLDPTVAAPLIDLRP